MLLGILIKRKAMLIVTTLLFTGYMGNYFFSSEIRPYSHSPDAVRGESWNSYPSIDLNGNETLHAGRIRHMQTICYENGIKHGKAADNYLLYSSKYKFQLCPVNKIGSTFCRKMFLVLENGAEHIDDLLNIPRKDLHNGNKPVPHITAALDGAPVVMVTRNPYSRLYSAYVDRQFLLPKSKSCTGPTFQEYLDLILQSVDIINVNPYVRPVSATCDPCFLKPLFLIKQETFASDVVYIMHKMKFNENYIHAVSNMLFNLRTENNVPGIVKTYYDFHLKNQHKKCFRWKSVARRLWTSFQIQGYINDRVDFPHEQYITEELYGNSSFLIANIFKSIRKFPMTSSEIEGQRARALARAYGDVSYATIQSIRKKYSLDFQLFNYSTLPPGLEK